MIKRMRWFFLSIAAIYLWLTPGEPLLSTATGWFPFFMPTWEGVEGGGLRLSALVLLILAVHALLLSCNREQIVSAIYTLSWPLGFCGLSRQRLAVRMVLVLDVVAEARPLVVKKSDSVKAGGGIIESIGDSAAHLFQSAVAQSESKCCHLLEITTEDPPPYWQWSLPLALALLFLILPSILTSIR